MIRIDKQFKWKILKVFMKIPCISELNSTEMQLGNLNNSIRYKGWSFLAVEKSKEMIKPSKRNTLMGLVHRKISNLLRINQGT
jgi:hypothetical protein